MNQWMYEANNLRKKKVKEHEHQVGFLDSFFTKENTSLVYLGSLVKQTFSKASLLIFSMEHYPVLQKYVKLNLPSFFHVFVKPSITTEIPLVGVWFFKKQGM